MSEYVVVRQGPREALATLREEINREHIVAANKLHSLREEVSLQAAKVQRLSERVHAINEAICAITELDQ